MPLLPLASPNLVPEIGAAAPAIAMSRKSKSVALAANALTVRVRCVPMVSDAKNVRYAAAVPAGNVNVPLMVWLALNVTGVTPNVVRPVNVRLLNVFAPLMVKLVAMELVKETL